ncbi:hypothetical protein N480_05855 [Pseudoalteromonas luteoviolacea S2607]|uniref:Uncharacterized protein n=1 Tax=Pseudoalteromonas luteoviolacea S4060-1 TaxID=1365257 RepID=A0A167JMA2_9GAMM|nr:hypothetical protein N480_05855 [Pseudoalteromonas luteoviolacea S2607]KZN61349.1 hypothetical protein N478_04595 [Pseudoalteromonas luteoviolacea S4060-1]
MYGLAKLTLLNEDAQLANKEKASLPSGRNAGILV